MVARRATATGPRSPAPRQAASRGRDGGSAGRARRRDTRLAFEALSIEGGLLSPDWLARVAALEAGGQTEADYRVPKGLQLRDEIGRYWRIAQAHWSEFAAGRGSAATPEASRALAERFVAALLRDSFGFVSLRPVDPLLIADRRYPIGFWALGGRVPVVIAPAGSGLETLAPGFGDGVRRRTAFGLAQEFLNAADSSTWGIACDGLAIRILRDNASLTRPAWIEANLERIFTEERYADFTALWLLAHETRFGREDRTPTECPLESWREAGREEGTRAREHLRRGVEEALEAFGQGFLAHPENGALRTALQSGSLTTTAYFQELLRVVYRLIFLLTVEERGLLHPEGASEAARRLYAEGYAMRRLRERAVRRSAHDRFSDLWEPVKIVFRGLAAGEPRLGLPALAGLFALDQTPALGGAKLENRALLLAAFRLSWLREPAGLVRVNWRDMGPEELGSVYESLLELVPQVTQDGRGFRFATGAETKGNARKTSGSYYTPDSLVQVLLDSALEPVVASTLATNPERPVEALLELSIVDPACGSGHFLLAAARRLAAHVARLQANGTPSAAEYRHALRQVVGRCLYGVDLNPMAVELCKVSLWMEAVEPGLPLTFLDAHVRHGNALLGTTPELMADGIPDAAWEPIEGDDRKMANALKKRNKAAGGGQRSLATLWGQGTESEADALVRAVAELEASGDADLGALVAKKTRWEGLLESEAYRHQELVANAWCAAFVWPKQAGALAEAAPTNDLWLQIRDRKGSPTALTLGTVAELATQYAFFHWHLAFPQVFAQGGFDVVIGNPPWERVKLQEKEWFASRMPELASANSATRKGRIRDLETEEPLLFAEFQKARRTAAGEAHLARDSNRYRWGARGDINTYALFTDASLGLVTSSGRIGLILPPGIATDTTNGEFFDHLVSQQRLVALLGFINERKLFPSVLHNFKFLLFVASGGRTQGAATCAFNCETVAEALSPERQFQLTHADLLLVNPTSRTCPTFTSRATAELSKSLYRRLPLLGDSWNLDFWTMFHMSNDSHLFEREASPERLPLYEAKMIHQYNHRFASYGSSAEEERAHMLPQLSEQTLGDPYASPLPYYYVPASEVASRTKGASGRRWLVGFREVTSAGLERTFIACALPLVGVNNKIILLNEAGDASERVPALLAIFNSLASDFCLKQKLSGASLAGYVVRQLPAPSQESFSEAPEWLATDSWACWLRDRVLELTYTSWSLRDFGRTFGYEGPPFRWSPQRRFLLRCELDAAMFHSFGFTRNEMCDVLDTFRLIRDRDEKSHGEYRTKHVVLEIYDAMAEAARTGIPYATRLEPPPGDPRAAHSVGLSTAPDKEVGAS